MRKLFHSAIKCSNIHYTLSPRVMYEDSFFFFALKAKFLRAIFSQARCLAIIFRYQLVLRATLLKILLFNFYLEIDFASNSSIDFSWQVSN